MAPQLLDNKAIKLTGKALARYPRSLLQPLGGTGRDGIWCRMTITIGIQLGQSLLNWAGRDEWYQKGSDRPFT